MTGSVLEIRDILNVDMLAEDIAYKYELGKTNRNAKEAEWQETRNYLFATDTTTTSNSGNGWQNKTTTPKLTQIRDNLHANYMSALFPNDSWFRWEGDSRRDDTKKKRKAIEAYMRNKLRKSGFEKVVSQLVYDFIDYGNVIADCDYVVEQHTDDLTGETITTYSGPRALRYSPLDVILNPTASSFDNSYKITRTIKTFGELRKDVKDNPDLGYSEEALRLAEENRHKFAAFSSTDLSKIEAFQLDGFGSLHDYYQSGLVEILEFEGNIHDEDGNLLENRIITIFDRMLVARNVSNPSWLGKSSKVHAAWRSRPDNLYGMGPLDNLVGLQYRIDHLENIKADLFDLIAMPPIVMKGTVDEFEWGPLAQIYLGEDGEIDIVKIDAAALQADQQIAIIEQRMERMAGAPEQTMGVRSPGEKTATEVTRLENAATRIFRSKLRVFELHVLEPLLNNMLEIARRHLDGKDVVRVFDDALGVEDWLSISKADITANGKLYPLGSRHFEEQAAFTQNMELLVRSGMFDRLAAHTSQIALASAIEDMFKLEKYAIFGKNVGIMEQVETEKFVREAQQILQEEAMTPVGDEVEAQ